MVMFEGLYFYWCKLQKRGGLGPVVCNLFLKDDHTIDHLFTQCEYTQYIWKEIIFSLKISDAWNLSTLEANHFHWFTNHPKLRCIPFLVCWRIWKYRNTILFENSQRDDSQLISKILLDFNELKKLEEINKVDYILSPIFFDDKPIGFFDGAAVNDFCEAEIYIKISSELIYKAHFAGGKGNNMKEEILSLWRLLLLAQKLCISKLMVVGDSKVTIDWIKDCSNLNLIYLHNWKEHIKSLKERFEDIQFMHIHREFNIMGNLQAGYIMRRSSMKI